MSRPPDSGIYGCTGCYQTFTGPDAAENCRRHVRKCARLFGAFAFAVVAFVVVILLRLMAAR